MMLILLGFAAISLIIHCLVLFTELWFEHHLE
ncbi:MAG: light-harvesting protein [Cyclobacteriaceae bacterium]|nr:light-harvesting protein [Cyclobacteriaceae bacterium]